MIHRFDKPFLTSTLDDCRTVLVVLALMMSLVQIAVPPHAHNAVTADDCLLCHAGIDHQAVSTATLDVQQLQFALPHRSLPTAIFISCQQITFARGPLQRV